MSFTVHHSLTDEPYPNAFPETEKPAAIAYAKDISKGMPYAVFLRQDKAVVMVARQGSISPAGTNPYDTLRSMRNRQSESKGDQRAAPLPPARAKRK